MSHFKLYRQYFEHQCASHVMLAHDPAAGSRVFEMISIDEAFGDLRSSVKEKDFFFRLIEYTYNVSDEGTHEIAKRIRGGFQIGKYYSNKKSGAAGFFLAMEQAEQVLDDIINKMIRDSQNGHPLFNHTLDSRQNIMVDPMAMTADGNYAGWSCLFDFMPYFDCTLDEADWTDGGLTPHEFA